MLNRRTFLKLLAIIGGGLAASSQIYRLIKAAVPYYAIPPTVHHVTENTATLYFRPSEHTTNGLVKVMKAGELVQEIPFATAGDVLRVQLVVDGLEPSTTYQYQVLIDGAELALVEDLEPWSNLQFTTPPYEFPLRVAAIGDSGFGDATTAALVDGIVTHNPHLLLHLGDVVYHMNQYNNDHFVNWAHKYFKPFQPLLQRIPHYPTFGNHELDAPAFLDDLPSYYWMFPPFNADNYQGQRMWYSFEVDNIQFLSLNSQLFYSYQSLRDIQEAWLDEKLARQDVLYTVVFFHVAPYTSAAPHQYDGVYVAEQWVPKFEAAKVPLVLSGHAHVYERLQQNDVNYVVAGAGSNVIYNLGERLPHSQQFWSLPSYPIIDLYADHIHLRTYDLQGAVIDEADLIVSP
jgi:hypothetical protein